MVIPGRSRPARTASNAYLNAQHNRDHWVPQSKGGI